MGMTHKPKVDLTRKRRKGMIAYQLMAAMGKIPVYHVVRGICYFMPFMPSYYRPQLTLFHEGGPYSGHYGIRCWA